MQQVVLAEAIAVRDRPRALIPIIGRAVLQTLGAQTGAMAFTVDPLDFENAEERVVVVTAGALATRLVLARTHRPTRTHR